MDLRSERHEHVFKGIRFIVHHAGVYTKRIEVLRWKRLRSTQKLRDARKDAFLPG